MAECTCPHVMLGSERTSSRAWSDRCPEHGVGTQYFQQLKSMPYGYADERYTTREDWMLFVDRGGMDDAEE